MKRCKQGISRWLWLLILSICVLHGEAQSVIFLQNPSFEDMPGHSRLPEGWFFCGETGETPPDTHPAGYFGVTQPPQHGRTYIGMVVRDNNTWEAVSQWLSTPLEVGHCYTFSLYAARSPQYESYSRTARQVLNFDRPVRLLLWGGQLHCDKRTLLAESPLIDHTEWQEYVFQFQPSVTCNRLLIEARHAEGEAPYCGNVLIDRASPLLPVDCHSQLPLYALDTLPATTATLADEQLRQLAERIRFSPIDQGPEQHVFYTSAGELEQGNRYLYQIVDWLGQHSQQRVIFAIAEENRLHFKAKKLALQKVLWRQGLNVSQYRIRRERSTRAPEVQLHW